MPFKQSAGRLIASSSYICHSCRIRLLRTSQTALTTGWNSGQRRKPGIDARRYASSKTPPERVTAVIDDETGLDKPVIRYYEKVGKQAPRRLRDEDDFNRSMQSERDAVLAQIEDLETKLADAGKLIDMMDESDGQPSKDISRWAGRAYRTLRRRGGRSVDTQLDDTELPATDLPLIETRHFAKASATQRDAILNLNKYLAAAVKRLEGDSLDWNVVMRVWKHYSAARKILSTNWQAVPPEVWTLLWEIFTPEVNGVNNRMPHIYTLTTDMQAAGVELDSRQRLLALEAMFVSGYEQQAIDNWKRMISSVGADPETRGDYWAIGLRMASLAGDIVRAERAADVLFETVPDADPRLLLPLIKAYAANGAAVDKAWSAYCRLREALGSGMKIEDYDEVIAGFLESSRTEYALHAFVDMMFSGTVDMSDKTRLPNKVANQFFLGKWLKRLIGAGDLDGAFQVLKYMESQHVLAAAIQVNGLIGAWMRSGTAENQQKAEDLAWAMIRSRMVYVDLRKRQKLAQWPVVLELQSEDSAFARSEMDRPDTPQSSLRLVPRATLESFSLLAENYRQRGMHGKLQKLWAAAKRAEIPNATFLLNQLLHSYSAQGKGQDARKLYNAVVKEQGVSPDGATFLECFRAIRSTIAGSQPDVIEVCRQTFGDMAVTRWRLDQRQLAEWLAKMILHTFRGVGDNVGLIVAVRAMRKLFDFQPSESLLAEMSLAIQPRRGGGPSAASRRLLMANAQIEKLLKQRVRERLMEAGPSREEVGDLTPQEAADELSIVLERLLWSGQQMPADEDFSTLFAEAAEQMGVYDVVVDEDPEAVARMKKFWPR
jgi:hypothetical protein